MSKKKLTKKKQLLALLATTSLTVNMFMAPLLVLAEQDEVFDNDSVVEILGKNITLSDKTMNGDINLEKESTDSEGVEKNIAEEGEYYDEKESGKEKLNSIKTEVSEESIIENQIDEKEEVPAASYSMVLTGSYEDGGKWTFNQENKRLVLSGGTLNGGTVSTAYKNSTWLRQFDKTDVLEIHVENAVGGRNMSSLFLGYSQVKKITFDNFDTSQTTLMRSMFNGCKELTELDLSTFNTSKVTGMSAMFYECNSLIELDLSGFNTEKLTTTQYMFQQCRSLKKLDLSGFDTSNVTNMIQMFYNCEALEELSLGSETKLANNDTHLKSLATAEFWYDEYQFLNSTNSLISYHNSLNEAKTYTIGSYKYENGGIWDFKNGVLVLTGGTLNALIGEKSWLKYIDKNEVREISVKDALGAEDLSSTFSGYINVEKIVFDRFDTSNSTSMWGLFMGNQNLEELDISMLNTSKVKTMAYMFHNNKNLSQINLDNLDTSNVTDMTMMFANCFLLETLNLSSFYTSRTTGNMFLNADNLNKLILGENFKLSKSSAIKVIDDAEFWHGEVEDNLLETSNDLVDYHNTLNKVNTYTLINGSETRMILTFNTMGGSEISPIETNYGNVWIEPKAPTKEGYNFMGWYTDLEYIEAFDFSKPVTKSMTIYAKWEEEKTNAVFEVDDYYIGSYNIVGRFTAPIVTAQLRINGSISNLGGTFDHTEGTFYYYAGAGRIQMGQEVVLEGIDSTGNIVETVKVEPKVAEGSLDKVRYVLGENTLSGEYSGDARKARLVVNGTIVSIGGEFAEGNFSYYVKPNQIKENDTVQIQGYNVDENPVGDLKAISIEKPAGKITEASYQIGDSTIIGTYEGNVKKARLFVDGKPLSWGGTFDNGIFTYYVASGVIGRNSTVELEAYGAGDVLLSHEKFLVMKK